MNLWHTTWGTTVTQQIEDTSHNALTVGGASGELLLLGVPQAHEHLALVPVQLQVSRASLLGAVVVVG